MSSRNTVHNTMRTWHRYLGFFLAGIMAVYALSGIVMIFRDTDFLKQDKVMNRKIDPQLPIAEVSKAIRIPDLKASSENGDTLFFAKGWYNKASGDVQFTVRSLPPALNKLAALHKANTGSPLFFLNVFFGVSLLFFVISSFWMFLPKTSIFKKGMWFALAGLALTLLMIFIR